MPASVATAAVGTPQQTLPTRSGSPAKASLRSEEPGRFFREILRDVMQRNKQGACAEEIGISEGRLSTKVSDGTFNVGEAEKLGIGFAVEVAEEILKRYGSLATPEQRAMQAVDAAIALLQEVRQFIAFKA